MAGSAGGPGSDRRVRRTRRRLKKALLELIRERRYDEITVREIAERADVGRSTFYDHFGSKEDLLFDGFEERLLAMAEAARDTPTDDVPLGFGVPFLEHVRLQRRFFRAAIVGGREARIRKKTTEILARAARVELARDGRSASPAPDDALLEARAHCVAGAFLGLLGWWLEDPQRLESEEVDRVYRGVVGSEGRT